MLIVSATVKKYLLKAFAISWRSLMGCPSIFKVLISSETSAQLRTASQQD
jgi:hypothetical protein